LRFSQQTATPNASGRRRWIDPVSCKGASEGMFPDSLAGPALKDGSFVRVTKTHLDVPLYWRCWKLDGPIVKHITEAVRSAAAELRPRE